MISRICWACDPNAPTTSWPILHLIARHHAHPTTHLPPPAYRSVAPYLPGLANYGVYIRVTNIYAHHIARI